MEFKILIEEVVALFAIINPLGNLPIFEGMLIDFPSGIKRKTYRNAIVYAFLTLIIFTFFGLTLLDKVFGISLVEFRFAGGIMLIVLGVKNLIFSVKKNLHGEQNSSLESDAMELAVTPIACPLLIGPGAILTSILNLQKNGFQMALFSIFVVSLIIYLIFYFSETIMKLLGKFGSILISRVMQIIIASLGVHFVVRSINDLWGG